MQALSKNQVMEEIRFIRCSIGDEGCDQICDTIKHLPNINTLDVSECKLSSNGALSLANMIKFQKICRYSEGWMKSLRYGYINPLTIRGLKKIFLNDNPSIKDEGVVFITEELKDDSWIKVIEMQKCGILDAGASNILQCLESNSTLTIFNIKSNFVSRRMLNEVKTQFSVINNYTYDGTGDSVAMPVIVGGQKYFDFIETANQAVENSNSIEKKK